jgi:pSer/pThr/pTyr-binding forkhead associated (FHA) protein
MPIEQDYRFGRLAVSSSLLKQEQLEEAIEVLVALEQVGSKQRLWDILSRKGVMTAQAIAEVRQKIEHGVEPELPDETTEVATPPAGAPQNYLLAHLSGQGRMSLYPLPKRMINLGSGSACDIMLPEQDVAECQARLRFTAEQFVIEDAGEGAGLHVNDRPILRQILSPNDLLQIGSAMLLLLADHEGATPEPVSATDIHDAPVARLRAIEGPRKGTVFFVGERPLVIGRHPLANVRISDTSVSDFHAHLRGTPSGFLLMDLKSELGTRVNALRVTRHAIQIGESLTIGPATFVLELLSGQKPEETNAPKQVSQSAAPKEDEPLDFDWDVPDQIEVEPATDPMMRRDTEPVRADPTPRREQKEFRIGALQLTCVVGPLEGKRYRPKQAVIIFGRSPKADIRIEDASVSKRHVELTISKGAAMVRDLGSRNGIYVNGKRIARGTLQTGDALRIGKCLFIVETVSRHAGKSKIE